MFTAIRLVLGTLLLVLLVFGYILNIVDQFRYGRIIDLTAILTPAMIIGVWIYVKLEEFFKRLMSKH